MAAPTPTGQPAPTKDHGRAGRDLKAAVGSAVVLLGAIAASLLFFKAAFMAIVAVAELPHGYAHGDGDRKSVV